MKIWRLIKSKHAGQCCDTSVIAGCSARCQPSTHGHRPCWAPWDYLAQRWYIRSLEIRGHREDIIWFHSSGDWASPCFCLFILGNPIYAGGSSGGSSFADYRCVVLNVMNCWLITNTLTWNAMLFCCLFFDSRWILINIIQTFIIFSLFK